MRLTLLCLLAASLSASDFNSAIARAEDAFERRQYSTARAALEQAVPGDSSEQARLLNARGTLHLVEGDLASAERELVRALELAELPAALHNLAAVEMRTGRLREAEIHQTRALALWQREPGGTRYVMKAWVSLSSIQGLAGDWEAAAGSLQQALGIAETPEALANYAIVLEKLKRGREAREIRARLPQTVDVRELAPRARVWSR